MGAGTLVIRNFKCFREQRLPFGSLNVLCGANGVGKSTVIQALMLFQASLIREASGQVSVPLNGPPGLSLGTVHDILHRDSKGFVSDSEIEIELDTGRLRHAMTFRPATLNGDENYLRLETNSRSPPAIGEAPRFVFLSAERLGPRRNQDRLSDLPDDELELGEHGEFVAEVLLRRERLKLRGALLHPSQATSSSQRINPYLGKNVELWLKSIFDIGGMRPVGDIESGYARVEYRGRQPTSDWVLTTNFGFGVTYTLPIIVGGLSLPLGGTLIIDTPEAHLHPAAQSQLATFLCHVASAGATVWIETHSEHIVDGIRLAIARNSTSLQSSDCQLFQFEQGNAESQPSVLPISMSPDGALNKWPRGFFDQQSITLRQIANTKSARAPDSSDS